MPEWCPCSTNSSSTRRDPAAPLSHSGPAPSRAPQVTCWNGSAAGAGPLQGSTASLRAEGGSGVLPRGGGAGGPRSVVDRRLVTGVGPRLQLERAVRHVEVLPQALAERVEHPAAVPGGQRLVRDDHVGGQNGQPGRDRPRV